MATETLLSGPALIALTKLARTSTEDAGRFAAEALGELRERGFVRDLPGGAAAITTRGLRYFEDMPSVPSQAAESANGNGTHSTSQVAPFQRRPLTSATVPAPAAAAVPAPPAPAAAERQFVELLSEKTLRSLEQVAAAPEGVEADVIGIHPLTLKKLLGLKLITKSDDGLLTATQDGLARLKIASRLPLSQPEPPASENVAAEDEAPSADSDSSLPQEVPSTTEPRITEILPSAEPAPDDTPAWPSDAPEFLTEARFAAQPTPRGIEDTPPLVLPPTDEGPCQDCATCPHKRALDFLLTSPALRAIVERMRAHDADAERLQGWE